MSSVGLEIVMLGILAFLEGFLKGAIAVMNFASAFDRDNR
jgi:hypothetical protein